MKTWYDYRSVWAEHAWIAVAAVVAVVVIVAAVVGTVLGSAVAVLFIPGLAALYMHHLLVQRMLR